MRRRAVRSPGGYERRFVGERGHGRDVRLVLGWDVEREGCEPGNLGKDPEWNWEDVEQFVMMFRPQELLILRLLREGKGPSDIAVILEYASRQRGDKAIRSAIRTARFVMRHREAIRKIACGDLPLRRPDVVVLQMTVLLRASSKGLAKLLGLTWRQNAHFRVMQACRRLKELGCDDVLDVVRDGAFMRSENPQEATSTTAS